jgi:RNA polymerase sigma-70 factor, ECF subfamily
MTEHEAELVAQCRRGDQEAFRALVDAYHDRVFRTAYALTGDPHDATEVEQDTFVKAWRGLAAFRGDAALATWLTRLALNAARDHLRRRRARAVLQGVLVHRRLMALRADGEQALQRVDERDDLDRAVRRLPPPLRQTLALYYGAELSVKEIAETLRCPEGTVKWRLSTGIARLRELLDPERPPGRRAEPRKAIDP